MKEEIKKAKELVKTLQSLIAAAGEGKEMKKEIAGVEIIYHPGKDAPFEIGAYLFTADNIYRIIDFFTDCDQSLYEEFDDVMF